MIFRLRGWLGKTQIQLRGIPKKIKSAAVTGKVFGILVEGRPRLSLAEFLKKAHPQLGGNLGLRKSTLVTKKAF